METKKWSAQIEENEKFVQDLKKASYSEYLLT